MPTLVYFECRDAFHLAAPSRRGVGGILFRHGTAAYCDGSVADGAHHWVPTGGVPLDKLIGTANTKIESWEDRDDDGAPGARHIPDTQREAHPFTVNP